MYIFQTSTGYVAIFAWNVIIHVNGWESPKHPTSIILFLTHLHWHTKTPWCWSSWNCDRNSAPEGWHEMRCLEQRMIRGLWHTCNSRTDKLQPNIAWWGNHDILLRWLWPINSFLTFSGVTAGRLTRPFLGAPFHRRHLGFAQSQRFLPFTSCILPEALQLPVLPRVFRRGWPAGCDTNNTRTSCQEAHGKATDHCHIPKIFFAQVHLESYTDFFVKHDDRQIVIAVEVRLTRAWRRCQRRVCDLIRRAHPPSYFFSIQALGLSSYFHQPIPLPKLSRPPSPFLLVVVSLLWFICLSFYEMQSTLFCWLSGQQVILELWPQLVFLDHPLFQHFFCSLLNILLFETSEAIHKNFPDSVIFAALRS